MARKNKVLVHFTGMKDDELMVSATTILNAMTDNVHFASPNPSLESIQQLVDEYSLRLNVSRRRGSPTETAEKNEARPPLEEALQKLGYYVNATAQGHLSKLLSSGFRTNLASSTTQVPEKVEHVRLQDGRQSGQVRLDFARRKGTVMYEYEYRIRGEENWSPHFSTTSSRGNVIAPLPVAQFCEVRVRGINSKGAGDWSDIATILVR